MQAEIKLLEMMARKNIRQIKQLSQMTGLQERVISNMLNGKKKGLRLDTIAKLCSVLECKVEELIVLPKENE